LLIVHCQLNTIQNNINETYRIKGSKFIGYLFPVKTRAEFENELAGVKSTHPDASHHCYAWRIDPNQIKEFYNDAGEPGGTAGPPILNELKSFEIINAGLIVVRYFGGAKLGKSGLIEAYGTTARRCLEQAEPAKIIRTVNIEVNYPYTQQNLIERLISKYGLIELDSEYTEEVTLVLGCPVNVFDECRDELERLEYLDISSEERGEGFVTT